MPRPKNQFPSYLYHKKSGQARVRLKVGGRHRDIYLGKYDSPESHEKYHRLLAEYCGKNGQDDVEPEAVFPPGPDDWTVAELALRYDDFARVHYVKNGETTDTARQQNHSVLELLTACCAARLGGSAAPCLLPPRPEPAAT